MSPDRVDQKPRSVPLSAVHSALGLLLFGAIATEFVLLLEIARTLELDYYDAFDYLGNARVIAEGKQAFLAVGYEWRRPPVVPLIQSFVIPKGMGPEVPFAGLGTSHLLAWTQSLAAVGVVFWMMARAHGWLFGAIGAFLVAANPMFLHLVPFAIADIPAMLFTTLALVSYLWARAARSSAPALLCAVSVSLAMATKYNLILLLPGFALFELVQASAEARPAAPRAAIYRRSAAILSMAVGLWLVLHLAVYARVEGISFDTLARLVETLIGEMGMVSHVVWDDPLSEYFEELYQVTPLALLGAGFLGIVLAIRDKKASDHLHLVWVALFLGVMTFAVGSKSTRYLLPILPSIVHLQLRGLAWCYARFRSAVENRFRLAHRAQALGAIGSALGLVAVLGFPTFQCVGQLRHFEDPIYRDPLISRMMDAIRKGTASDASIYWRGTLYSIYPERPVYFPHDETFYFYHLGPPAIETLLDRPVDWWTYAGPMSEAQLIEEFDGDVVLIVSSLSLWMTHLADELPEVPTPLQLHFIDRRSYARQPPSPETPELRLPDLELVMRERSRTDDRIRLSSAGNGFEIPARVADDGWSIFSVEGAPGTPLRPIRGNVSRDVVSLEFVRIRSMALQMRQTQPTPSDVPPRHFESN